MDFPIRITKQNINGSELNSVNARHIHDFLHVKTKFSDWIKRAIERYDFIENQDYAILKNGNGNNAFIDYVVTIDMAKELSMLENNPKGKATRKYFIEFEKRALKVLNSQSTQIQLLQETLNQIAIADQRITKIESNFRIENWQQKRLEEIKNQKVYELVEKHGLNDDAAMIKKLHSRVWKCLKNRFNIPRYNELPMCEFDNGVSYVKKLTLADLI